MTTQNLIAAVVCSFSFIGFAQLSPSDQLSEKQIKEDMTILYQSISEGVIEVYWYRDQSEFRAKYDSICGLKNGMRFIDFYREVTGIVSSMGCLHSYIQESPLDDYFFNNHKFIPIGVNNTESETFISYSDQNRIPVGSKILEINGQSIDQIRTQMFKLYGTDGYVTSVPKYGTQNDDFAYFYKHYIDTSESFQIIFESPNGIQDEITLEGIAWELIEEIPGFETVQYTEYPYGFNIENKIAILNIESSSRSECNDKKWAKFLSDCFGKIDDQKIDHLIIDVRRNSGGWMPHMFHLVEYFANGNFTPITEAWQKSDKYEFMKFSETPKQDFIKKNNRDLDSLIGAAEYDNWLIGVDYKPKEEHHFKGQVYILTGGNTHSAASRLVSTAKEYANPIVVGDYPGGCFIGGSGGNTATVVLPNSKISINIALTFFKPSWFDINKKGIAVEPDHFIEQEIGKDAAMEFTMNQIKTVHKNK